MVVNINTVPDVPDPPDPPIPPDPPVPPTDCGAVPPNGKTVAWASQVMFQVKWPGPKSRQAVVAVPKGLNGWVGVPFTTTSVNAKGGLSNFEAAATAGSREISISKCPGEFVDVPDECWQWVGASQRVIPWSTYPIYGGYCILDKNTKYYFNVRFNPQCTGTYCNTTVRATNRDL